MGLLEETSDVVMVVSIVPPTMEKHNISGYKDIIVCRQFISPTVANTGTEEVIAALLVGVAVHVNSCADEFINTKM